MKAYYKKEKGRKLELRVAQMIRESGLDKDAMRMPLSGSAFGLETDIKTNLPLAIECKNQEKIKLWEFWEQAERGRRAFKYPCLIVSGNYRPELAVMKFEDLLNLLAEYKNDLNT
jgi:hypothetical protein